MRPPRFARGTEIRLTELRNIGCGSSVEKFAGATIVSTSVGSTSSANIPSYPRKCFPYELKTVQPAVLFRILEEKMADACPRSTPRTLDSGNFLQLRFHDECSAKR